MYKTFEKIEKKREKKNMMRYHIYLDALIILSRMKREIEQPVDELIDRFFTNLNKELV